MGVEIITVAIGGMRYTAWKKAEVRASSKEAARSFTLVVAAETGPQATKAVFAAGKPLTIYANGDLLLTGFVDRYQPKIDAEAAEITIAGRSKTGDLVDSSAKHKTGRFKGKKPSEIANELTKDHGIKVKGHASEEAINHQLTPGKTVFNELCPLWRSQGLFAFPEPDGNWTLRNAQDAKKHRGALIEGRNIKTGSSDHNWSGRHSEYVVKGQTSLGHGEDALQIEQAVKDAGVDRHRPVIVVQKTDTTKARAKKTAKSKKDEAAGNSLSASITVQGFRDEAGEIWTPGKLVWTESPFLDLAQDMLIETATYRQDEGGSLTDLSLVDPRAQGGKAGKGSKSGSDWDQGGDDE